MATSGEFLFSPQLAEIYDEAFERAKIDPSSITAKHVRSAQRSVNYMLAEWGNEVTQWVFSQAQITAVKSQATYSLPATASSIVTSVVRRNGVDTPMVVIARATYIDIPEKLSEGLSVQYFVQRGRDTVDISVWPVPENNTDIFIFDYMRRPEDAGEMQDNPDIPYRFQEAFVSGLACRIAEKYSPPKLESGLRIKAEISLDRAMSNDQEPASIIIIPTNNRGPGYHGRGR